MERLQSNLFEAAAKGCISSLQQLLSNDPLILDRVVVNCFNETPLHVAAMLGHINFVHKIITIKPQLVNELNSQRSSPLHLASAKGHVDVVKALLAVDHQTCLARDRNGLTPLHLAAIKGRDEVIKLLLEAQPEAARLTVYREETILHLCVKNYQLEALKLLLTTMSEPEFVNSKDGDGNTILHLAVADKQVETITFLLTMAAPALALEVNALNHEGLTAMDVLIRSRRDVRDSEIVHTLEQAGGVVDSQQANNIPPNLNPNPPNMASAQDDRPSSPEQGQTKSTDGLMVVAILIASMAFQIGVNPPGGVWQDDNFLLDSQGGNRNVSFPHRAGYSILASNNPKAYKDFYRSNTIGFFTSLFFIFILMTGLPMSNQNFIWFSAIIAQGAITAVVDGYSTAVNALTPKELIGELTYVSSYSVAWKVAVSLYVYFYSFRLLLMLIRKLRAWTRRRAATSPLPHNNVV